MVISPAQKKKQSPRFCVSPSYFLFVLYFKDDRCKEEGSGRGGGSGVEE
jgi:hypothetical protein